MLILALSMMAVQKPEEFARVMQLLYAGFFVAAVVYIWRMCPKPAEGGGNDGLTWHHLGVIPIAGMMSWFVCRS